MAKINMHVWADGITTSWRVKWQEGGRAGDPQTVTFDNEKSARRFSELITTNGNRWLSPVALREFGYGFLPQAGADDGDRGPTLVEYAHTYVDRLVKPSAQTKDEYRALIRNHVEPFFTDTPLIDTDRAMLRRWQQEFMPEPREVNGRQNKGAGPKTILNVRGSVLAPMFAAACLRGDKGEPALLTWNPMEGLDAPEKPNHRRPFLHNPDDVKLLLAAAYDRDDDTGDLIAVTIAGGLRWGEIAGMARFGWLSDATSIEVSQVAARDKYGPKERRWFLREGPKTEAGYRRVPVATGIAALLDRRAAGREHDALMFTAPSGALWHHNRFHRHRWSPVLAVAREHGLRPGITPHGLRKSMSTWLAENRVDPVTLKGVFGHKRSATVLDLYTDPTGAGHPAVRKAMGTFIDDALPGRPSRVA